MTKVRRCIHVVAFLVFLIVGCVPWGVLLGTGLDLGSPISLPSFEHPFGTDSLGRCMLVRFHEVLWSTVFPLWALTSVLWFLGLVSGVLVGIGKTSSKLLSKSISCFQFAFDLVNAVPIYIFVFAICLLFEKNSSGLVIITIAGILSLRAVSLGATLWETFEIRHHWIAHKAIGGTLRERVLGYGLFQDWKNSIVGNYGQGLQSVLIVETSLSYLGFGVQEPQPSFGNMLSQNMNLYSSPSHYWFLAMILIAVFLVTSLPTLFFNQGMKKL